MRRSARPAGMRALILMFLLTGCSLLTNGALASGSLDGDWRLQAGVDQGQPVPIVAGSPINLKIDGSQAGGTAACNSYGGKVQVSGNNVSFGELVQTEMACLDDRVMASEAAYMTALQKVTKAKRSDDALVLSGPGVELRFALIPPVANADLVGTTWILESLISGDTVSSTVGERATLQLNADGTFAASTGCRDVTGHYTVERNQVQATLDPYDTFACGNGIGDQDNQVLKLISGGFTVTIQGQSLTLTAGDKGLSYRANA
jgi:heat shock protein HslJ